MARSQRSWLGVALAGVVLAAGGCSGTAAGPPDTGPVMVDVQIGAGGIEVVAVNAAGQKPALTGLGAPLSFELRDDHGAVLTRGRVADPRDLRTEWDDGRGLELADERVDGGLVRLRLPRAPGTLTLRDAGGQVVGTTRFAPDTLAVGYASIPADVVGGHVTQWRGSADTKRSLDVVILSEGYTDAEMQQYRQDVARAVNEILNAGYFGKFVEAINFWRVDVRARRSGLVPAGGDVEDTAFGVRQGGMSTRSVWFADEGLVPFTTKGQRLARAVAGDFADVIVVLVNTPQHVGTGGGGFVVMSPTMAGAKLAHELGHAAFGLADEYAYPNETANCRRGGKAPNVSAFGRLADLPWRAQVAAGTPVPTRPGDVPAGQVGAFEGAAYCVKGMYRPAETCMMRDASQFCPVCMGVVRDFFQRLLRGESQSLWEWLFGDTPPEAGGTPECPASWRGDGTCDLCLGDDPDCAGVEDTAGADVGDACAWVAGCEGCSATPGCGYCGDTGECVAGDVNGPAAGACLRWRFLPSACVTADPCAGLACEACTSVGGCGFCASDGTCQDEGSGGFDCLDWRPDAASCPADGCDGRASCELCSDDPTCGWCATTGSCVAATGNGTPAAGACADWRPFWWECAAATTDDCAGAADCGGCVTLYGCGFCTDDGTCRPGSESGASGGGCAAWAYHNWQCVAADPCAATPDCGDCTVTSGCGFCADDGTCRSGDQLGPFDDLCEGWQYYDFECAAP